MPSLVLIHIGDQFPDYINTCIAQVRSVSTVPIHVLVNDVHRSKIYGTVNVFSLESMNQSELRNQFNQKSRLDAGFRNGFWKYAAMRFIYLYEHVVANNLTDVFHIENDNLIYVDFTQHLPIFQTKSMWCVMDAPQRCIPAFLYFKDHTILAELAETCVSAASRGKNDMQMLATFRNNNLGRVDTLPIVNTYCDPIEPMFYENAPAFNCLFDAAAIGQYIGGVDPRNSPGDTRGFINETSVVKPDKLTVEWRAGKPFLNNAPLVNLHIHSKDLSRWTPNLFDVIVPVGPSDVKGALRQLEQTKKNIVGRRHIYIVTPPALFATLATGSDFILIDETIFPFTIDKMNIFANIPSDRHGWYLQQLIKMYAGRVIPGILDKWLVIDADTFFLRPTKFIEDTKCLYAHGTENHAPYFQHMNRLLPGLRRVVPAKSGICHHMIFDKQYVNKLFEAVEETHGQPFWTAFLKCVDIQTAISGASEYEIYFNYMLTYHPNAVRIRQLSWKNVGVLDLNANNDYISWHHYMRSHR